MNNANFEPQRVNVHRLMNLKTQFLCQKAMNTTCQLPDGAQISSDLMFVLLRNVIVKL